jgi:hypothetical protein
MVTDMRSEPDASMNLHENFSADEPASGWTSRPGALKAAMSVLVMCAMAFAVAGCAGNASAIAPPASAERSDAEIVRAVQDWLAQQTYDRLAGAHVADRLVTENVGYKSYNCYNSISFDGSPTWNVKWDGDRYEVTAALSSEWRGYQELTWDYYPETNAVERAHAGKYC